jgi:ubiquinone/menaquinone biosynthesis C-methylase UbiE
MGESVPFDRIADRYDDTRGGLERGHRVAADLAPHLAAGAVLEVGVGTGLVAVGLRELGRTVIGVDLSLPMLRRAHARLGPVVVVADAAMLPLPDQSVADVVLVHVLHLVGDLRAVIVDAARVLTRGGRLLAVHAAPRTRPDELTRATDRLRPLRDRRADGPAAVAEVAESVGLRTVVQQQTSEQHASHTPNELADLIQTRTWSFLWEVPADEWAKTVEPVIAALRGLSEPDRARHQVSRTTLSIFEK